MHNDAVRTRADALLLSLGKHIGIEDLAFDDHAYACLSFDEIILNIEFDARQGEFVIYADLGAATADADNDLLTRLLEANFAASLSGGGSLSMSREARRITFTDRMLVDGISEGFLQTRVAAIVDRIETLQGEIGRPGRGRDDLIQSDVGGVPTFIRL